MTQTDVRDAMFGMVVQLCEHRLVMFELARAGKCSWDFATEWAVQMDEACMALSRAMGIDDVWQASHGS